MSKAWIKVVSFVTFLFFHISHFCIFNVSTIVALTNPVHLTQKLSTFAPKCNTTFYYENVPIFKLSPSPSKGSHRAEDGVQVSAFGSLFSHLTLSMEAPLRSGWHSLTPVSEWGWLTVLFRGEALLNTLSMYTYPTYRHLSSSRMELICIVKVLLSQLSLLEEDTIPG